MGGRYGEDSTTETLAKVRETVAGLSQRVASNEATNQREFNSLRQDVNEKFAAQKQDNAALVANLKSELKAYIDQKFLELGKDLEASPRDSKPAEQQVPATFWLAIVIIGAVSAVTFLAFVGYLYFN